MKYASITSLEVERSFPMYQKILSDIRVRFITENLEKYTVINFFFFKLN